MCISAFLKYMLLSVVVGTLVIFAVFYDRVFYFIPAMVFAIIWSRIRCPKCETPILKDDRGWYMFTMRSKCRTCGHDTMICDEGK